MGSQYTLRANKRISKSLDIEKFTDAIDRRLKEYVSQARGLGAFAILACVFLGAALLLQSENANLMSEAFFVGLLTNAISLAWLLLHVKSVITKPVSDINELIWRETQSFANQLETSDFFKTDIERDRIRFIQSRTHSGASENRYNRHRVRETLENANSRAWAYVVVFGLISPAILICVVTALSVRIGARWVDLESNASATLGVPIALALGIFYSMIKISQYIESTLLSDARHATYDFLSEWWWFRTESTGLHYPGGSQYCPVCGEKFGAIVSYRWSGLCRHCYFHEKAKSRVRAVLWLSFIVVLVVLARSLYWHNPYGWIFIVLSILGFSSFFRGYISEMRRAPVLTYIFWLGRKKRYE